MSREKRGGRVGSLLDRKAKTMRNSSNLFMAPPILAVRAMTLRSAVQSWS